MPKKLLTLLALIGASSAYAFSRGPAPTTATAPAASQKSSLTPLASLFTDDESEFSEGSDDGAPVRMQQNPAPAPNKNPSAATASMGGGSMMQNGGTGMMSGAYKNGTFTGSVADAYYGPVQVQATVSGGKITDVSFLQSPSDRSTSRFINSQAMPMLSQEAVAAQSAQVNIVSGATHTSMAFQESLASALALAKS